MVKCMLLHEDNIPISLLEDSEALTQYVNSTYKGYLFQVKQNGIRAIISIKDGKITAIRNRKNTPVLQNFTELKDLEFPNVKEALIDTEIVMLDDSKKSHYYNVYDGDKKLIQAGIQYRSLSIKDDDTIKKYPVNIVVFDILKLNDEVLISKPYNLRYKAITDTFIENERFSIAKNYTDFKEVWDKVVSEKLEGVVAKNPNGFYELDTRSKNNIKIKHYKSIVVNVYDTEQNNKGLKCFAEKDGIKVEFQYHGINTLPSKEVKIKYLERVGNRLIQPTIA